jgi:hypothetical protein
MHMVPARQRAHIGQSSHLWPKEDQQGNRKRPASGGKPFPYCSRSCSTANNVAPTLVLTPTLL